MDQNFYSHMLSNSDHDGNEVISKFAPLLMGCSFESSCDSQKPVKPAYSLKLTPATK